MYAPSEIRKRFKDLTSNNLKGTGDYGLFAVGAYNGQTLNKGEKNNDLHRIVRVTYPFKLQSGQFIEASVQAYEGNYQTSQVKDDSDNVVVPVKDFYDQRTAASLIYYPQPFGFQMEYNIGQGPDYNKTSGNVENRELKGGYVQVNYQTILNEDRYFPYVRYQEYEGGRKLDNGNHMETRELEFGTEWQTNSALELTVAYAISDRKVESATSTTDETGQLLRLQAQFNY
jgi:hypothetical protein